MLVGEVKAFDSDLSGDFTMKRWSGIVSFPQIVLNSRHIRDAPSSLYALQLSDIRRIVACKFYN